MKQRTFPNCTRTLNFYGLWNFSFISPALFVILLLLNSPSWSSVYTSSRQYLSLSGEPAHVGQSNCKALIKAIEQKDYSQVRGLLGSVDPNCTVQDPERKTTKGKNNRQLYMQSARSPLVASARIGDLETGRMLVKAGADVSLRAPKDETPLIAASASGNLDFVKFLIDRGAEVNRTVSGDGTALIAASRAGNLEIVKFLISKGAEIDQIVGTEGTALINAIRSGHYEVSKILLEHGADPSLNAPGDENPFYHARKQKDKRFLRLLNEKYQGTSSNNKYSGRGAFSEDRNLIKWVQNIVDSTMEANNIPALSIGIVRDGELWYSNGFGFLERGSGKKVTEHSLYQIGSDTKKLTGIIVRNLVTEGKLELEKSILDYLPNEALTVAAREKLKKITVKDMLLHRSGIPNRAPGNKRIDGDPMLIPYTEQDLIKDLNSLELDFEPDSDASYSNFGYAVLCFIAECTSGEDYHDLVDKYITKKYALENTFVNPDKDHLSLIVTPYRKDDREVKSAPWKMGKIAPAGGVYSNIIDLSRLMTAQIEAYKEYKETGETDNPLILTDIQGKEGSHYGFGLQKTMDETTGNRYGHGGDLDGYASGYVFSPEKGSGLIILASSGGSWFGNLESEIRKKLNF